MTVKVKSTNGNGKSADAKNEVKKEVTSKVENPVLSLDKKIEKVEQLQVIIAKWRKLNETKKNLMGFQLGDDGMSATMSLTDSSGRDFKTSNSMVVSTVLDTVQTELDGKILEIEKQINFEG